MRLALRVLWNYRSIVLPTCDLNETTQLRAIQGIAEIVSQECQSPLN